MRGRGSAAGSRAALVPRGGGTRFAAAARYTPPIEPAPTPSPMPVAPFVEIERIDLDQVAYTKEDLYEVLKQRGRFAVLDAVVLVDNEHDLIVGYKDIRAEDWWAADHIPGRPLFPGALMVEASAQLSAFDFMHRVTIGSQFVGFTGIDNTRFRTTVEPPCRLVFVCRKHRIRGGLFQYQCQGFVGERLVFETEVSGMVL